MTDTVLSAQNEMEFRRIADELRQVCQQLTSREWMQLLIITLGKAGSSTVKTKVDAIGKFMVYAKGTVTRYSMDGISKAFSDDCRKVLTGISDIPARTRRLIGNFVTLPREKQVEQVIVTTMTFLMFYMSAGGSDLEGGLPDLDLKFGLGFHRNILSHSILLGLGAEFFLRFITELILMSYDRLPSSHHRFWDGLHGFIKRNHHLAIAALWAGIGAHLFKDAALFSPRTKPVVGLPGSHSMTFHKTFYASNGVLSGLFAGTGKPKKKK